MGAPWGVAEDVVAPVVLEAKEVAAADVATTHNARHVTLGWTQGMGRDRKI